MSHRSRVSQFHSPLAILPISTAMNLFCRILGHTWVHQARNPLLSWNTTKGQAELAQTELGSGYSFSLRCQRCGLEDHTPSPQRIAKGV